MIALYGLPIRGKSGEAGSRGQGWSRRFAKISQRVQSQMMRWAIFLLVGVAVFRCVRPWVGGPENFAPLAALALCGSLYFPRPWSWAGPMLALLVSDLFLNLHYGLGPISESSGAALVSYFLISVMGARLAQQLSWRAWLGGSLAATLIFYVVTNTGAWWSIPIYEKSWSGWVQALTVGIPGYPPTWTFLRSSLISDLLFTGLFVAGVEWSARRSTGKNRSVWFVPVGR